MPYKKRFSFEHIIKTETLDQAILYDVLKQFSSEVYLKGMNIEDIKNILYKQFNILASSDEVLNSLRRLVNQGRIEIANIRGEVKVVKIITLS